ncbi:hypothetical protein CVT26_004697 [Gymnopilus dilepis]|uniref:G domain-containing protein n=1 Tax=Gymnopilus dilepis TaxID=231916 RepID=A0A409XZD5_9AGAR|nr:hypothetical protein CVT26_004697 [Gymnopilus dilepis]
MSEISQRRAEDTTLRKDDIVVMSAWKWKKYSMWTVSSYSADKALKFIQFINALLGEERMGVGETLAAGTVHIDYAVIQPGPNLNDSGSRLVIVDTPGLNDRTLTDSKIISDIIDWIEKHGVKDIAGVIYLYDISQDRHSSISGMDLAALRASFQNLDNSCRRLMLVTTKWAKFTGATPICEAREDELKRTYWKYLVEHESQVKRFQGTSDSAWDIINCLMRSCDHPTFDIQDRLFELRRRLSSMKTHSASPEPILALFQSVTGLVGSGKSTFINALLENNSMAVGRTLASTTTNIQFGILNLDSDISGLQGRRLVVVDTPGLNNRNMSDKNILLGIIEWVTKNRVGRVAGVLYLYDIFQQKHSSMSRPELVALRASFKNSEAAYSRVFLITTKWGRMKNAFSEGETREEELRQVYWKTLIGCGSQVQRFEDTADSARAIVHCLLQEYAFQGDQNVDVQAKAAELRKQLLGASQDAPESISLGLLSVVYFAEKCISVIGPTGSGKSTFINCLLGEQRLVVGKTLKIQTVDITQVPVETTRYPSLSTDCDVFIVDTPGFDDSGSTPFALVLHKIRRWMTGLHSYVEHKFELFLRMAFKLIVHDRDWDHKGVRIILGGVIYLHDIANNYLSSTAQQNIIAFLEAEGVPYSKVVIAITKWERIARQEVQTREAELKRDYWETLMARGVRVLPFQYQDPDSGWKIVDVLVNPLLLTPASRDLQKGDIVIMYVFSTQSLHVSRK